MSSRYNEFGLLAAEISSLVWGILANFNGFCVLASLLQRRRSTEANQTLRDVLPSPGLVRNIYIFRGSCPVMEFLPGAKFTLRPSLVLSYIGSVTARHSSSGRQLNWVRAEGATYIRQGGHQVGHWPTF